MLKRHLAASAVAALAVVSLAPAGALAAGATSSTHVSKAATSPFVKTDVQKALNSTFKTFAGSFTATGKVHSWTSAATATPATTSPITGSVTVDQASAYSVSALPSVTDSAADATITKYVYDFGDGTTATTVDSATAQKVTHTYAALGVYTVTVTVTDSLNNTASVALPITTAGSDFTPVAPERLLDTRAGTGATKAKVAKNGTVKLQITGTAGIPTGATAVVLNVTVTNAVGSGNITVYPDGFTAPTTSNLNYAAGQTVPNLVIAEVGADGKVDLLNNGGSAGPVDLIADVTGYFKQTPASGYVALPTPDRLVDTRSAIGGVQGPISKTGTFDVQITGNDAGKLPSSGITAVALNITATAPTGSGFLTAFPAGGAVPDVSNVNYVKGQTVANSAVVPVNASTGQIEIANSGASAGTVQVIVDVVGYYSAASTSAYIPVVPSRIVDTRTVSPGPLGVLPNDKYIYEPIDVNNGEDLPQFTAFVMNATVTDTAANGLLTVAPDPNTYEDYVDGTDTRPTPPNVSTLNWTKGKTVPNLVQSGAGTTGLIDFWNLGSGGGNTDLIVDFFGYYDNN